MNLPHVHLLLNHFPIIGTIIALGVYLCGLIGKSDELKKAGLVILTGIALLAIPTYMSGNGAADKLSKLPGISKNAIAAHNNAAVVSMFFMEFTGLFAWLGLWQYRRFTRARAWTTAVVTVLALVTVYFMAVTGTTGGQIRHAEILTAAEATELNAATVPPLASGLSMFVTGTKWMWPVCETLHFIGLSLLMGVVLLVDLRMMGWIKRIPFHVLHRLMPWAILGFAMNVMTGMLFFIGSPGQYFASTPFQWKMMFVLVAGANAIYFTMFDEVWDLKPEADAPMTAKLAASGAVVLWIAIMWCGNMLPFIGDSF